MPSRLITGLHDVGIAREAEPLGAMTALERPLSPQELLRFVAFSMG